MFLRKCSRLFKAVELSVKSVSAMPRRRSRHSNFSTTSARPVLRVLVDMDGVLCDFEQHFLDQFKLACPEKKIVPLENRRTFYLSDDYGKMYDNSRDLVSPVYEAKGFFENLPPIEGAVEAVKEMSGLDGVEVFFCTSPVITSQYCIQEKFNWIEKYFGRDWLDRMVLTKDKTIVKGHILIDDKPYIKGKEMPPMWDHILFTCWHNRHLDVEELRAAHRIDSWTSGQWQQVIQHYQKQLI